MGFYIIYTGWELLKGLWIPYGGPLVLTYVKINKPSTLKRGHWSLSRFKYIKVLFTLSVEGGSSALFPQGVLDKGSFRYDLKRPGWPEDGLPFWLTISGELSIVEVSYFPTPLESVWKIQITKNLNIYLIGSRELGRVTPHIVLWKGSGQFFYSIS